MPQPQRWDFGLQPPPPPDPTSEGPSSTPRLRNLIPSQTFWPRPRAQNSPPQGLLAWSPASEPLRPRPRRYKLRSTVAAGLLRYLGRASAKVLGKLQGLGPDVEGRALLIQAGPAGVLRPRLTALLLCDQREAPAAVSELREGDAGIRREGARYSRAIPSPVPCGPLRSRTLPFLLNP